MRRTGLVLVAVPLLSLLAPGAVADDFPTGTLIPGVACRNDPTQTYTLYLPGGYTDQRRWPVLYVFDPRGRSEMAAEIFREAAETYGWILMSSDNTRSDGPWEPNRKAVAAMGPELARYAFDPRRIYAAGFSGGAVVAWIVGLQTESLAGVIASGGRPVDPARPDKGGVPFALFGAAGEEEFNYEPMRRLDDLAARRGAPHRFEAFEGGHRWMPPELAREAVEWMELQAMRAGTRPADEALAADLYARDLAKAVALEREGRILDAWRRYGAIVRTFEGLHDVDSARLGVFRLGGSADLDRARDAEKAARRWHGRMLARVTRVLQRFVLPDRPASEADRLATDLRLTTLRRVAEEDSYKGVAARRVISSLSIRLSFYLPRDFFEARDYTRAAVVLELATTLDDTRPGPWYNLACARSRLGELQQALRALDRAVRAGYDDLESLERDEDLDPLRELPGYRRIVSELQP